MIPELVVRTYITVGIAIGVFVGLAYAYSEDSEMEYVGEALGMISLAALLCAALWPVLLVVSLWNLKLPFKKD